MPAIGANDRGDDNSRGASLDMTYNLCDGVDLSDLLAPSKLIAAAEILDNKTLVPDVGGIFGWWFDAPLPGVPLDGTLAMGAHRLLYVGIAPRRPSSAGRESQSTLRRRITRNHLGSHIRHSTLRRSLAALLRDQLSLVISAQGRKSMMSREHENLLTEWMASHASVSLLPHGRAWDVEEQLVAADHPRFPLNVRGANHEFVSALRALRRVSRKKASNADTQQMVGSPAVGRYSLD